MTRNTRASIEVGLSGLGLEHQFRSYGFIFIGVVPVMGIAFGPESIAIATFSNHRLAISPQMSPQKLAV